MRHAYSLVKMNFAPKRFRSQKSPQRNSQIYCLLSLLSLAIMPLTSKSAPPYALL